MKNASALALVAAALAMAGAAAPSAHAQSNVLIGNATAGDTQAAANDKLGELITKYSNGKLKASARHGQSLGNNAQMVAALRYRGYDHRFVGGSGAHDGQHGGAILPDSLRWLWRAAS